MSTTAAIKIAQKQLGLDDDVYRAKLHMITGKSSTKDMTETERQKVITEFRRLGFQPIERRQDGRLKLTGKFAGKLQALWIAAYHLGITRERDDAALIAFVKRQTGIDHVRWLKFAEDARSVVEAMKGWIAREGGVDWSDAKPMPDWMRADGYRIARAQWTILVGPKDARIEKAFWISVAGILGRDVDGRTLTSQEWITVMNAFGRRVRQQKGMR